MHEVTDSTEFGSTGASYFVQQSNMSDGGSSLQYEQIFHSERPLLALNLHYQG